MCLPLAAFHPGCLRWRARCFLGFSRGRDDFQGCNRLHIGALRWEGPLCVPQPPPAVPWGFCSIPGSQTARAVLLSLPRAEGELGIFHINASLGFLLFFFSHCMEKSISPSGAGGRGFSQHGQTLHCSLWRGSMGWCQIPASPALSTGLGTGHCGMVLWGSPGPPKLPGFVCSVLDKYLTEISTSLSCSSVFPGPPSP